MRDANAMGDWAVLEDFTVERMANDSQLEIILLRKIAPSIF
jgi:hypothetical protein